MNKEKYFMPLIGIIILNEISKIVYGFVDKKYYTFFDIIFSILITFLILLLLGRLLRKL